MSSVLCTLFRGLALSPMARTLGPVTVPLLKMDFMGDVMREQVRLRSMRASRRIRGYPRPLVKGVVRPVPMKYGYRLLKPDEYTTEELTVKKLAGRDPVTGRVVVRTIGGGVKRTGRWVDFVRTGPTSGPPFEEKVYEIIRDGMQTAFVALVANGVNKRWIIATEGVHVGDIIRSTREIPRILVRPRTGDAHPLGALPVGTRVHCIEKYPEAGASLCRAAGASAEILRRVEGRVIIQLATKLQISLNEKCVGVVGQVSNADRINTFYPLQCANRKRRLGIRPRSGFWHRKDGYCGRKVRPPPPVKVIPLKRPATTSQYVL